MDRSELIRIAYLYYEKKRTQQEIANEMGMSVMSISRMLKKAFDEGVVSFQIDYSGAFLEYEQKLQNKYQLLKVIVVPDVENEESVSLLAKAAAKHLSTLLDHHKNFGIGWGRTLSEVANQMVLSDHKDAEFIPLVGGYVQTNVKIHANSISYSLAEKTHGKSYHLYAPAILDSKVLRDMLMVDASIKEILDKASNIEVAMIGIGSPLDPEATLYQAGYISKEDEAYMKSEKAICDMVSSLYLDVKGKACAQDLVDRTVCIQADELRNIPNVIAIAGGQGKWEAIKLALESGIVNTLITDEKCMHYLLESRKGE